MRGCFFHSCLLLVFICCLCSCKCRQQIIPAYEPVMLHERDSVRTEYVERVRIDTVRVEIPIPAQSVSEIVRDSVSVIETDFACSVAKILPDGSLFHHILNKELKIGTDALIPVKDTQSSEIEYVYKDIPVKVPYAVEVEKKLTAWQSFRIGSFWWLVGAVLVLLGWNFRKRLIKVS